MAYLTSTPAGELYTAQSFKYHMYGSQIGALAVEVNSRLRAQVSCTGAAVGYSSMAVSYPSTAVGRLLTNASNL